MKTNILANIRVLAILAACLTVLGVGNAWGTTATLTLKTSSGPSSPYEDANGVTWTFSGVTFANSNSACIDATSGTLTITPPSGATVTQISVTKTGNAWAGAAELKLFVGTSVTAHSTLTSSSSTTTNISITSTDQTAGSYKFTNTTAKNCWVESITITYTPVAQTITFDKQGGTFDDPSVFINTNQIKEASGGAGITLPLVNPSSACASEGWGFYGWATAAVSSSTTTAPTIVGKAGDTYHPSSSRTLYAVFAQGEYTKETSAITDDAKYLIVANSGGDNYIMKYGNQTYGSYTGTPAAQINETSSGKYAAHAVNATWAYTLDKTSSSYYIRDNVNSSASNYVDFTISGHWYQNASSSVDPCTFSVSAGVWSIKSDYSSDDFYLGYDDEEDYAFFAFGGAKDILLYKAGTINYWSTPSCCDNIVALSAGTKTNVSSIEFSETSVATCGDQASRSVTVTVTTNSGYEMTGDLSFSKSIGTVTATKSTGPTGTGPYTYVYYFNQNDNGAGSFDATASAKSYTVTLNDNNGSGGSGSKSVTFNSNTNMTSAVAIPERTHYIFGGYWTSANSGATLDTKIIDTDGTWVASVSGYTDATPNWIKADNVTLYAKWTEHTYTNYRTTCSSTYDIVLDKNGGDADGSAKVDANATKLKSISAPTKTGHKLSGYYAESGTTNLVAAVDGTLEEDVEISSADWTDGDGKWVKGSGATLYAGWTPISYEVRFNSNDENYLGTAEGSMSNESYDYDESKDLTDVGFTLAGYDFAGWALTTDGSVEHEDGAEVENLSETDGDVVDLYAIWTAKKYTLTLANTDASSGSSQTVQATYNSTMPMKTTAVGTPAVAALSRTGYTFTGWSYSGKQYYSYDGSSLSSANNWDVADSKTLSPDWSINSYTLTWSWNGGSTSSTTHTTAGSVAYGTTLVYPANNTMSKTGYTFEGWSSTPSTMPASATTITAQWSINDYNVAVLESNGVTITATPYGGDAIAEGNNDDAEYNSTVTLNYSSLGSGLTWGGWRVTKADDASVSVSVSGTGTGATFTMPAYDVKVTAIVYSVGIAWCDPDVEVTGSVYLTSTKDVPVRYSTSGSDNLITISSSDMGSATTMEVAYLNADAADVEVDKDDSPFRFYKADGSATTESIDLDYEWGTSYPVRYKPSANGVTNNYKLKFIFKRGDKVLKTVTHAVHGRSLPEEFVIAVKKDGQWVALPSNLASTSSQPAIVPQLIIVNDANTPTAATYAPTTAVYKAKGSGNAAHISTIRFTTTGSNYLQVSSTASTYNMWLSTSSSANVQDWQLKSSDFNSYELTIPSTSATKKMGLYTGGGNTYMGYHGSPNNANIYLLPVSNKYTPVEITDADWMQDIIGVTASTSANKMGIEQEDGTKTSAVALSSSGTSHAADFDGNINFTELTGDTILLTWYNGTSLVGGSQVVVPNIILAGDNDEWTDFGSAPTIDDYVVLSKPMTIDVTDAQAKRIEIDKSGANTGAVEINPGMELIVAEAVRKYDGTSFGGTAISDLYIGSNADGNGALVAGGASDNTAAGVGLYTKARKESGWVNQFIGVPLAEMTTYNGFYGMYVYGYDDANDAWKVVSNNGAMYPFTAYNLLRKDATATTLYMEGTLNLPGTSGTKVLNMGSRVGDHLFANSWTAPIDVKEIVAGDFTNAEATIYIFNAGTKSDYTTNGGNYTTSKTNNPGQWLYMPVATVAASPEDFTLTVIPSMEAFMVKSTAASGSLTLDYKKHVYDPAVAGTAGVVANRAPSRHAADNGLTRIRLYVTGASGPADNLLMFEREDFSAGFDNGWEARKVMGSDFAPQMYATTDDGKMAINCVPNLEGTVIGFKAGTEDDNYTFTFDYAEEAEPLYLLDVHTSAYTRVTKESSYSFFTPDKEEHNRFILTRNAPGIATGVGDGEWTNGEKANVQKIIMEDHVFILRGGQMYDVTGKKVQ